LRYLDDVKDEYKAEALEFLLSTKEAEFLYIDKNGEKRRMRKTRNFMSEGFGIDIMYGWPEGRKGMKDPERIHKVCAMLEKLWCKYPDLRLGQFLIGYVFGSEDKVYYQEDEVSLDWLKKGLENEDK